jgi:hypothetical protein
MYVRIFRPEREVTDICRKLHNKELHNFTRHQIFLIWWDRNMLHSWRKREMHEKNLVGKPDVVTPLGRHWPEYVHTTKHINKHYRLSWTSGPIVETSSYQWANLSRCLPSLTFDHGNRSTLRNAALEVLSRVLVTIDGVCIGNWIYWPLTGCNCKYSKCHVTSNKSNPAHSLWWEEFLNTRSSTSHTIEPTPLSEICLLRIQGYSWPCSKLRDTCFNYNTIADFHTTNHSALSLLSLFPLVFTW